VAAISTLTASAASAALSGEILSWPALPASSSSASRPSATSGWRRTQA
jgi:hypothetical protein